MWESIKEGFFAIVLKIFFYSIIMGSIWLLLDTIGFGNQSWILIIAFIILVIKYEGIHYDK